MKHKHEMSGVIVIVDMHVFLVIVILESPVIMSLVMKSPGQKDRVSSASISATSCSVLSARVRCHYIQMDVLIFLLLPDHILGAFV